MEMLAPVIGVAGAEARKKISSATSSGVMKRAFSPWK